MSRIELSEERCKGCMLCTLVCPKGLLRCSKRLNAQGYKVAEIDPQRLEECTGCTSCALICPDTAIAVWRTGKDKESSDE